MNLPFNFVISDTGVVTCFSNGKRYTFPPDFPHYDKVKQAIANKDIAEIERLGDIPKSIETYANGNVKVEHGVITYKGRGINNTLTRRILKLMNEGFPFEFMLRFLDNLMQNPSRHAVQELYNFLLNRNLPITENGCFLAYKTVDDNYMDWHTHTVRNQVGDSPEMERNEVDDEWRNMCSSGFHVGAIEYVQDFHAGHGHIMIVEVNPKDVVSVPTENNYTKCRTCKYTVVGEMVGELLSQVYRTSPTSFAPSPAPAPTVAAPMSSMSSMWSPPNPEDAYDDDDEDDEDYDLDDLDDDEDDEEESW